MRMPMTASMRKFLAFVLGALAMAALCGMLASCAATAPRVQKPQPTLDVLQRVHFATGSDLVDVEAQRTLGKNIAWLDRHPDAVLVLEGHCDERGDAAYNEQLGDRRARRVKASLIAGHVDAERLIMVVSHGEERPLDARHTADAWRQNRRVEFIVR